MRVLEEVVSSSLKTCQVSLQIGVRTSAPVRTEREYEEARHASGRKAAKRSCTLQGVWQAPEP